MHVTKGFKVLPLRECEKLTVLFFSQCKSSVIFLTAASFWVKICWLLVGAGQHAACKR
jgi:hypothetical protein